MLQGTLRGEPESIDTAELEPRQVKPIQIQDPRPDLRYDSKDWTKLLSMVHANGLVKFAWLLHGFRCGGLRLHRGAHGYVFRPDYDPATSMWQTKEEYVADRDKWLVPWQGEIVQYLSRLTQERN